MYILTFTFLVLHGSYTARASEDLSNSLKIGSKLLPTPYTEPQCYPVGSSNQPQYLIGYGSLMQKASKDRTNPNTGENVPIRVYGFTRSWTCKGESVSSSTTYLGVDPSTNSSSYLNAVFFRIPSAAALANYDTRESFYCRVEVPMSVMQLLSSIPSLRQLPRGQYWMYITRPNHREVPSQEYPMVQSYVDTFMSGCIEIEEKYKLPGFAKECLQTTSDWSTFWVNDRIYPRRPFMYQPMASKIDRLLHETVAEKFASIKIEG